MRAAAGTDDISGADNPGGVALAAGKLKAAQQAAYRQYVTAIALLVPAGTAAQAGTLLRDQLGVLQYSASMPTKGTQVQIGPVLDRLYGGSAAAQSPVSVSMTADPSSGVWSYTAPDASWTTMAYYTYSVRVFSRCPDADGAEGTPGGSVALLTAPE
jgi:pullulanase